MSNSIECLEHREEAVAEVVASLAWVSRREARDKVREAVRLAAAVDEFVKIEYNPIEDSVSIICPGSVTGAAQRISRVWDACWEEIRQSVSRLSRAA